MLQVRRDLDLGEEPLDAEDGAEFRLEHLQCDEAVVLEVARQEDGRHAAGAEFALDGVAVAEGLLELVAQVRCRHPGLGGSGEPYVSVSRAERPLR